MLEVKVIGAGLAGCEAAWQLAERCIVRTRSVWDITMPQHGASCSSANRISLRKRFIFQRRHCTGTQLTTMRIRTRTFT